MGVAQSSAEAVTSLILSAGLVLVGLALAAWLLYERRHREGVLSPADSAHFARQDVRRTTVALILGILAIGIPAGSRISPAVGGRVNPGFVQIWLGVSALVILIVILAMADWLATRAYARRHFRELAKERIDLLKTELEHLRRTERNGDGTAKGLGENPSP